MAEVIAGIASVITVIGAIAKATESARAFFQAHEELRILQVRPVPNFTDICTPDE